MLPLTSRLTLALALALTLTACATSDGGDDDLDADGQTDGQSDSDGGATVVDYETVALSELSTTASYYSYDAPTATVAWFAVLDAAGEPHVAFDACEVCYGAGLGYDQNDETMVCNNCGNVFDIEDIGTENQGGGCWPGYLPIEVTDTEVIITHADLESGAWYFE